jgi:nucleoid-associated protein YgaU
MIDSLPPQKEKKMSNPGSPNFIAQHTVAADETLSHIALKYYGSAVKEKWMLIYEANKDTIGENPNLIRPGLVLNIPPQDAPSTPSPDEFQTSSHKTSQPETEEQKKFD